MITPYYSDELVTLYHGDARVIAPQIPEIDVPSIVLCDPAYTPHTHGASRAGARKTPLHDGSGRVGKAQISRTVDFGFEPLSGSLQHTLAEQAARLSSSWVLFFCDVEGVSAWIDAGCRAGLEYVRTGAWIKEGATPQFTGDRPGVGFECIVIAHVTGERGRPLQKRWNGGGSHAVWSVPIVLERGGSKTGEPRLHETQKPEALICELVKLFSDEGECVVDFTAGSCTTLVCARRLGRKAIGIELREGDCEKAAKRLMAERAGVAYHAAQAGQVGLFAGLS